MTKLYRKTNELLGEENMKFRLMELLLLTEDIESMKKYFPNIPDEQFQSLIELDPTYKEGSKNAGTYGRWILTLANKGKLDNIGHVKDLLTRFNEESKYLKNKDIMRYKTMQEVEDMLNDESSYKEQSHRQEVRQRQKDRKNADLGNEAEKVYEDSKWEVWIPKTYAASCKLGQGASWCTASTESDYYYNYYKNNYGGNYYININKNDPEEKYQFHFESNQFMDADDYEIDLSYFLAKNTGLRDFYSDIIYDTYVMAWGLTNGETEVDTEVMSRILANRTDLGSGFLEDCFKGYIFEHFIYYGDYSTIDNIEEALKYHTSEDNTERLTDITGMSPQDDGFLDMIEEDFPEVRGAVGVAESEGQSIGAEEECLNDFDRALKDSMKPLIESWEWTGSPYMPVKVNMENLKEHLFDLIASNDGDAKEFSEVLAWYMYDDFNFYEPRYGWYGFSDDAYNERLSEELYDIDKGE